MTLPLSPLGVSLVSAAAAIKGGLSSDVSADVNAKVGLAGANANVAVDSNARVINIINALLGDGTDIRDYLKNVNFNVDPSSSLSANVNSNVGPVVAAAAIKAVPSLDVSADVNSKVGPVVADVAADSKTHLKDTLKALIGDGPDIRDIFGKATFDADSSSSLNSNVKVGPVAAAVGL